MTDFITVYIIFSDIKKNIKNVYFPLTFKDM